MHILIRIKSKEVETFSLYQEIIAQYGSALFAKVGQGLKKDFIDELNDQIDNNVSTRLFLAVHEGWDIPLGIYECELVRVHKKIKIDSIILIPTHVHKIMPTVTTWFEIKKLERCSEFNMDNTYILNSGRPLKEVIRYSASVFKIIINN